MSSSTTTTPRRKESTPAHKALPSRPRLAGARPRLAGARPDRAGAWLSRHRNSSFVWLLPTLLIAAVVQATNLAQSPRRVDDEGTYVAQAWALTHLGELAHYTYWYDHPPLGWFQIAAYTQLTDAFDRWDMAVLAGREAMVVAMLISAALLWALARRLGLARPTAAAAVLIFTLSPLAVTFHRFVYLDNVALPWLLAAFLLAMTPKHQLVGFAASAAAFGVAVLTKETFLLALPFLIWTMARHASPQTRRYTMSVAGCVLVLVGSSYLLLAAIKGELLPNNERVSLFAGVMFQLVSRESGGSIFDPTSSTHSTWAMWWSQDPVLLGAGIGAAAAGLLVPRLRPLAALLAFHLLFMLRSGFYLPIPYVVVLLPFMALLIAAVAERSLVHLRNNPGLRRWPAAAVILGLAYAATAAVPVWTAGLGRILTANEDRPAVEAQRWVEEHVPRDNRVIVDDIMWVDLVEAGFPRSNVLWHYKLDTDADVIEQSPNGWRDSDFVVTTDSIRGSDELVQVQSAIENSEVVASFGSGPELVEVRRIYPEGLAVRQEDVQASRTVAASIGPALAAEPDLDAPSEVRSGLAAGEADPRILIALQQKLTTSELSVTALPVIPGENGNQPRQLVVGSLDGAPALPGTPSAAEVRDWAQGLPTPLRPLDAEETAFGVLLTWPVLAPSFVAG